MSQKDENVLCVRRELFDRLGSFQGLNFNVEHYLSVFLNPENNVFVPRSKAEDDPTYKQLIPYVVLTHKGRILHYVRGGKGGEQRLKAKGSIGIGGHINDEDAGLSAMDRSAYHRAVEREINEELHLKSGYTDRMVAVLNDDSVEVGRVHLGVVHVFELETDAVETGESAICDLELLLPEELEKRKEGLESWSQIVFGAWSELCSKIAK